MSRIGSYPVSKYSLPEIDEKIKRKYKKLDRKMLRYMIDFKKVKYPRKAKKKAAKLIISVKPELKKHPKVANKLAHQNLILMNALNQMH